MQRRAACSQIYIDCVLGCVTFLGGFLVAMWGAVLSLAWPWREQQGGPQIATAISTIAGGAIIIAA